MKGHNIDVSRLSGNWNYPTSIRFGAGRIRELPDACKQLGMQRPLLVTDPGLAALPMVGNAAELCRAAGLGCQVFSNVRGNPVEPNVSQGVDAYREGGHDGVIAFGGGSALDAGKAIALMVGQTRPLFDFEDRDDWWTRVNADAMAPVVAVPTTSGTGSEVGRASVITDERDHTKKIIFHPKMLPAIVIDDPELTVGLPPHITAAVGMDALSHNLEAYCSPVYHPLAQGIALEGMRLVKEWLPVSCSEGNNLMARAQMQVASTMGATAFQKGLGAMHAMSHPCGAVLDTHHGLTNAVVMPYVLMFNRAEIEEKLTALARYLNLGNPSFDSVLKWILDLRQGIGIPHTLTEIGVLEEHIETLAPMAEKDPSGTTNPVPLTKENLSTLFEKAICGQL
ncbi:MAG: iron-containing alcohol dehydrogenase [Gammaproteobacteria bacterium]|nr:iron-containing alcohol dehydrogenase [Gammaproteobacteria bacterium]MDH3413675.1 iron-containing alcohol dehydrogenase [Gammaproteobacteria bacterium]